MMKSWATQTGVRIRPLLEGRSRALLVENGTTAWLVDTGIRDDREKLLAALRNALPSGHLDGLLLTHTHFDHTGNAAAVVAHYHPTIFVHESEADFLRTGYCPLPNGTNILSRVLVALGRRLPLDRHVTPVEPSVCVRGCLDLGAYGLPGIILPTPGHTVGSLSLLLGDIALVGDTLFGIVPGRVMPPFADDVPALRQSWRSLLDTGCTLFIPAHGRPRTRSQLARA